MPEKKTDPTVIRWIIGIIVALVLFRMWASSGCNPNRYDPPRVEDFEYTKDYLKAKSQYDRDYDEARRDAEHEARQNW